MTNPYIMVVDDSPNILAVAFGMLTRGGYEVRASHDGREALALYRAERALLVLTDIVMPDFDGLELIRSLRALDRDAKIIAMTGGGDFSNARTYLGAARGLGACATLTKPFTGEELLALVGEALGRSATTARA